MARGLFLSCLFSIIDTNCDCRVASHHKMPGVNGLVLTNLNWRTVTVITNLTPMIYNNFVFIGGHVLRSLLFLLRHWNNGIFHYWLGKVLKTGWEKIERK